MDKDNFFFRLLRIGLGIDTIGDEQLSIDGKLSVADVNFSICQGVGAFIFDGLQKATEACTMPADAVSRELKMKLFSHTMQVEKLCRGQYDKAAELASIYAEHSIRTVVLKGIAIGQCYPNPWHRPCGDLDCYLLGDYKRGNEIAKSVGAHVDDHSYKHSHIGFKGLVVENHQFCTPISGCKRTKRFERFLHEILAAEGATKIGKTHLETPLPMFNAFFLTHHGRNHFLIDGITLRHLCDWAMLLHKYGTEIDWEYFCRLAEEYGLRLFADTMTRLSRDYLSVKIPKGYVLNEDNVRDGYLMSEMLLRLPDHVSGKLWRQRLIILGRMKKNRRRYQLFSDESFEKKILKLAYGLFFDRYPKL